MIYCVKFTRNFRSLERAHLFIGANSREEAIQKANITAANNPAKLRWKEDPNDFEETDRDVWVDD